MLKWCLIILPISLQNGVSYGAWHRYMMTYELANQLFWTNYHPNVEIQDVDAKFPCQGSYKHKTLGEKLWWLPYPYPAYIF